MKNLVLVFMVLMTLGLETQAQYNYGRRPAPHRPYPHPSYPYPSYPRPLPPVYPSYPVYPGYGYPAPIIPIQPLVATCTAYGLGNGLSYYATSYNVIQASQNVMILCQSYGQICQPTGCR